MNRGNGRKDTRMLSGRDQLDHEVRRVSGRAKGDKRAVNIVVCSSTKASLELKHNRFLESLRSAPPFPEPARRFEVYFKDKTFDGWMVIFAFVLLNVKNP